MRKKRLTIVVVVVVALAIIVSAGVYFIPNALKQSKASSAVKAVDKKSVVEKVSHSKNDKAVTNDIVIKKGADKKDVSKLVNDYLTKVVSETDDKVTKVTFKQDGKTVEDAEVYKNLQVSDSKEKYSLRIQNGFLPMNRFIEIKPSKDNAKRIVSVKGENLRYNSKQKVFYGIVNISDAQKIIDSIKINN